MLTQLQQSLLSKADVTAVGEALDLKANKASVAAALHGKANKDKIEPRLSRLEAFAEVRKESRADAPTSTAHTCGRCVCHDHCTHTPITTTPPVPPAAPAVQVIDTSDFVTKGSLRTAVSDLQTSLDAVRKELQGVFVIFTFVFPLA